MAGLPKAACERLVHLRQAQGLTQTQVAEKAGLAIGYINQIEHGNKMPGLRTLLEKIGPAYGISNPSDLLVEREVIEKPVVVITKGTPLEILRVGNADRLAYEALPEERVPGAHISVSFVTIKEHDHSGTVEHPGEEIIYIIEGSIELAAGYEKYTLEKGELAHYRSTLPHRLTNTGDSPVRLLIVKYPVYGY